MPVVSDLPVNACFVCRFVILSIVSCVKRVKVLVVTSELTAVLSYAIDEAERCCGAGGAALLCSASQGAREKTSTQKLFKWRPEVSLEKFMQHPIPWHLKRCVSTEHKRSPGLDRQHSSVWTSASACCISRCSGPRTGQRLVRSDHAHAASGHRGLNPAMWDCGAPMCLSHVSL